MPPVGTARLNSSHGSNLSFWYSLESRFGDYLNSSRGKAAPPQVQFQLAHDITHLIADNVTSADTRGGPAFPTRNGTRQHPDNVRSRMLASVRDRANELLSKREQPLIVHMTPHTLRRTFSSILAEVGVPPRRAMYLLGHTDPTVMMRVYQQVLDMGGAAVETLERVLGCTLQEALSIYSCREGLWTESGPGAKRFPSTGASGALKTLCRA